MRIIHAVKDDYPDVLREYGFTGWSILKEYITVKQRQIAKTFLVRLI